jgi:hypothetical protein
VPKRLEELHEAIEAMEWNKNPSICPVTYGRWMDTLREPEQAQGDSMVEQLWSSSSWQILHCFIREEDGEHDDSWCSITLLPPLSLSILSLR